MGSQRINYTSLIFLVAFPTRGRAEQTGGSQSADESRPSLPALRFKQLVSLKFLLGSAPRIQRNLRCPTLDEYPPALIQVTPRRRVQQRGFQHAAAAAAAAAAAQVEGTHCVRDGEREPVGPKCFRSAELHNSTERIWRRWFCSSRGRKEFSFSFIKLYLCFLSRQL